MTCRPAGITPISFLLLAAMGTASCLVQPVSLSRPPLVPAAGLELVTDGDFEGWSPLDTAGGWEFLPSELFSWDYFGRSGCRSIFIDASLVPQDRPAILARRLPRLQPDTTYLLQVSLFRDHGLDGIYPTVSLAGLGWRLNDFWTVDGWQTIPLFIPALPAESLKAAPRLEVHIPRGNYRLWIDDLSLKPFRLRLLGPPSGSRIDGRRIPFAWTMTGTDRLVDITLKLSRSRDFRPAVTQEYRTNNSHVFFLPDPAGNLGPLPEEPRQEFVAPGALPQGQWYWRVEARQYRKRIAQSPTWSFVSSGLGAGDKPPSLKPERPENIDYFPFGMYSLRLADLEDLSRGGFNTVVLPGGRPETVLSGLESCRKLQLKALMPFHHDYLRRDLFSPYTGTILGWYLADEPEGMSLSPKILFHRLEVLRKSGFRQLGAVALNRSWRAADYASATDVFLADPYPIPFNPLSWLSLSLDEIQETVSGDPAKRVWAVIQAFGWNDARPELRAAGQGREPFPEELRALTWLALVHGARGLFFYGYRTGAVPLKDKGPLWQALKETVREVKGILPLILSPESEGIMTLRCQKRDEWGIPAVHFTLRRASPEVGAFIPQAPSESSGKTPVLQPGSLYLLAVNTLETPVIAEWQFAREPGRTIPSLALDILTGETLRISEGRTALAFRPFERKVLCLE